MADAGVIIKADLRGEDLTDKIDKLVKDVDSKFSDMAQKIDDNVQLIKLSLGELGSTAQAKVSEIKQAFTQLGTTFDQFARAMERAAAAASGVGCRGGSGGVNSGGNSYPQDSIGKIKSEIKEWEQLRDQIKLYDADLRVANNEIERLKGLLKEATKGQLQLTREVRNTNKARERQYMRDALSMEIKDIQDAERKLNRLNGLLQRNQNTPLLNESQINRIKKAITATTKELERLKLVQASPQSMVNVMGMSEKTLDEIALKMKAISTLRANTSIGNKDDINQLNTEYARLSKLQSEVLGKTQNLVESNNSLGRAFNYIKNRLAFMLTVGAFTGFVRQLYEVRGQYELLERSLGVLLNSFTKGQQVFQELSEMAIRSPFTLIELGTAAKQLTAYNFKANEVVNTTKRMADIASAVGVPIERLVYNLGQIRAQTVLTARDARDFANAGLPIVSSLADMYSKLEGRVVSTGDVFDRMKKKAVSYNDVMTVINQMTDEGGKFFDFQAKQAGTLKVQMANLTLALNNMLNAIGESNQGLLSAPVQALKTLFQNWQGISNALTSAAIALGAYKVTQMVVNRLVGVSATQLNGLIMAENRSTVAKYERIKATRALTQAESAEYVTAKMMVRNKQFWIASDYELALAETKLSTNQAMRLVLMNKTNVQLHKALVNMGLLTQAEVDAALAMNKWTVFGKMFVWTLQSIGRAIKTLLVSAWPLLLITAISEIVFALGDANDQVEAINQKIKDSAKETAAALRKYSEEYDSVRKSLYKYDDGGNQVGTQNLPQDEARKAWDTMRAKIEESVSSANTFIAELEDISDINERLRRGFGLIDSLTDAQGKMESLKDDAIDVGVTVLGGLFGEGLKRDLQDYMKNMSSIVEKYGDIKKAQEELDNLPLPVGIGNVLFDLQEINDEISKVTDSMAETFTSDKFNFDIDQQRLAFEQTIQAIADKQEMSTDEIKTLRIKAEHEYYKSAKAIYERLLQVQQGQARKVTQQRLKDLEEEFNTNKSTQETFFQWLSDTRSSETQRMLQNMTKEELAAGEWMNDQNKKWIREQAQAFSKDYGVSFDDLWNYVRQANTWKIYIPVYFQNIGNLTDFQTTMKAAGINQVYYQNAESTVGVLSELKKRQKEVSEEIAASTNAKKKNVPYSKTYIDSLKSENESLTQQIHNLNGLTDAEEKALKERQKNAKKNSPAKRQKQGEDAVAKALKDEISVIKEMQSAYDKLRKAGVNTTDALTLASSGYDRTLKSINATLSKYGISPFKAEDFVGSADPHKLLTALQNQLDTLIKSGKVKTASLKDLEMEIQKITVDAKEYDMKRITDGLNNELGKIKEEYELAVELDANPELGDMFAQAFGIDTTGFPKTVQEAVDMMQDSVDKAIAKVQFGEGIDIDPEDLLNTFDILRDDIDKWSKATGIALDSNVIDAIQKMQKEARDLYTKDAKQTISDWQKLLEKYAQYETKRTEIQKQAEKERETARKHGASQEIFDAIDLKEQRNLAKLEFDEFQKSATWITATGDLSNLTNKALQMLIDRLWEYKRAAKNLDPKEIIKLNNALRKLRKEQKKDNPFADWSIMLDEAKQRMEQYQPDIDELNRKIQDLMKKQAQQHGILSDEDNKTLGEYLKNLERLKKEQGEVGKLTLGDKLGAIQKYSGAVKEIADSIISIADGLGAEKVSKAAEGLKDALGIIDKAEAGYKLGGKWGAIAGALVGITEMVIKWADNDQNIVDEITRQQRSVKELENQYKSLEQQIKRAYGSEVYAIQKAQMYNKKLQLDALEEQLRLEESRASKHKDEDAIISLKGQIIDLKNEIHDMATDVVNDMLGITSVGDAAENMVKSMIEAFKSGEDYMKVFEESFEDMIDNMIMKAVVSRLIGDYINKVFDSIYANALESERAKQAERDIETATKELNKLKNAYATGSRNKKPSTKGFATVEEAIAYWEQKLKEAQDKYAEAITPTPEDIAAIRDEIEYGKVGIKEGFEALMEAFGIRFGQNAGDAQLSALQQGIMGITEETAGALEAYMNGVSQQVYLQSDLLTQIRDILINFGGDVTIATNAQILLQLQQSFQVQMTIQNVLTGVLNASGLAFRVEMV